jgi:hypothetical protein
MYTRQHARLTVRPEASVKGRDQLVDDLPDRQPVPIGEPRQAVDRIRMHGHRQV